jgi:hypothetical protein
MRDERYEDDFDDEYEPTRSRSVFDAVESILLLGALALIATPAIKGIARRYKVRHPVAADESAVDDSLNDTYPASDPPASRFVDIPSNRR